MWFFRDSALAGTAVIQCFNTLNNCSTSITNQPTKKWFLSYECVYGVGWYLQSLMKINSQGFSESTNQLHNKTGVTPLLNALELQLFYIKPLKHIIFTQNIYNPLGLVVGSKDTRSPNGLSDRQMVQHKKEEC